MVPEHNSSNKKKASQQQLKALKLLDNVFFRCTQAVSLFTVKKILTYYCNLTFEGKDHLNQLNQCIFAPTHYSHLDFWAVLSAVPCRLREATFVAAAKDHFYSNPVNYVITKVFSYHNFPFERQILTPHVYQYLIKMMAAGCSLLMFPQGTRSRDGRLQPFKSLIALLAVETQTAVVPVAVQGTYEALPAGKFWIKKVPIKVIYGEPLKPPMISDIHDRKQLLKQARKFNEQIMSSVERLVNSQKNKS